MIAIVNGMINTVTKGIIEKGTILIENDKIVAVGEAVEIPEGTEVIDAEGRFVFPGFLDAHTHLGIYEEGLQFEGNDTNELTDPVTAQLRALDAINPEDVGFKDAIQGGVTTVWTAPGSGNVLGGEGVGIKVYGKTVEQMVIKNPAGLKGAFGENPKRVYSGKSKMPSTRMGTAAIMRESFVKGLNYLKKVEKGKEDPEKMPERDLKLETIAKVLNKEMPLRAHAHRADDIMTAIRIAEEFDIDIAIEHCTEGHKIVDELVKRSIPAVVGPSVTTRAKVELKDRSMATPGILAKAGVKVAICTDHPVYPIHYINVAAGLAIKEGMTEEDALKALTINPAEIIGVAERVGSIEAGKDADIVIWDGSPFEVRSNVCTTIINGKVVYDKDKGFAE